MFDRSEAATWPYPPWVGPKTELVAAACDAVSFRRFRLWYDRVEAGRDVRRFRRDRRRPFLVEQVDTGRTLVRLSSWPDAVAWEKDNVISAGWRVLNPLPEVGLEAAGEEPARHAEPQPS